MYSLFWFQGSFTIIIEAYHDSSLEGPKPGTFR